MTPAGASTEMTVKTYLVSLPERIVRSALGLGAGVAREVGELALPDGVRQSRLYQNLVDATLRLLIERVGGAEGLYGAEKLPDDVLVRRTAGNAIEVLGVVAFRASPVWVLAALADVCGTGRVLIPEIADALKVKGLLEPDAEFGTVDQLLDGLERTSGRLAQTVNTPPLDVPGLRAEWAAIREEARSLRPESYPSKESIGHLWTELKSEAERQNRSIFETSSMLAVSAARAVPGGLRWLGASARTGAERTGRVLGAALLDHYRETLGELREVGYTTYATRQLGPYVRAAVGQFSPARATLTERAIAKAQPILGRFRVRRARTPDGQP